MRKAHLLLFILVLAAVSLVHLGLADPEQWFMGLQRLAIFSEDLFPPRTDIVPLLAKAMLETIEIAFLGTVLGWIMSLPMAFLATRQLFPPFINVLMRLLIGAVRSIPSILWGVIFVIAFGLGPQAGVIGVAFYTLGYLAKIYYEAFEATDPEVLEAVKACGARRLQLFRFAVLPESANIVISQALFMFEYNVRASAIMGFVGAGGIGYYMMGYVQMLQYQSLMTAILLTFVTVMIIDQFSHWLRSKVILSSTVKL